MLLNRMTSLLGASSAAVVVAAFLLIPAVAAAAPLNETEPNESVIAANGPFPADGFLTTRNTTNDLDFGYTFLQPQTQVTFSVTMLTASVSGYSCSGWVPVVATDWLGRKHLSKSVSTGDTYSWTTPTSPVRLDVGYPRTAVGCQILFKVQPPAAVFAGPLPAAPLRSIAPDPNAIFVADSKQKLRITGSAWEDDRATARLQPASSGQCPATNDAPSDAGDYPARWSTPLPSGSFDSRIDIEGGTPGVAYLCSWLVNPSSDITTLLSSKRVNVLRRGTARLLSTTVKRGKRLKAKIRYVKGFVEFRFARNGETVRSVNAVVRGGLASVSTSKLRPATYKLSIYGNGVRLKRTNVWVRRR